MNPDGHSDWFAILRNSNQGGYEVALTQPFTKQNLVIPVGTIPDGTNVPLPVAQEDGTDLMAFYGSSKGKTHLVFKDLSGGTISEVTIPNEGQITVGNYLPGPGEEVAVSSNGMFFIYNPISEKLVGLNGPKGIAQDSININTVG
jgi:hypothetical protein